MLALGACTPGSGTAEPSTRSASVSGPTTEPLPSSEDPIPFEPGTYRISKSAWSVVDFTVTFPEGWTVQYGHVYSKHPDEGDEFGFYAIALDEIYADACDGSEGELVDVGSSVDDLAAALLQQAASLASQPVDTTLGGYPATRIDLTVPEGFDLKGCNLKRIGLQIWYSAPADKYLVLLADGVVSVYIVDVGGRREVFLTQNRSATSGEDLRELKAVLDSIHIET